MPNMFALTLALLLLLWVGYGSESAGSPRQNASTIARLLAEDRDRRELQSATACDAWRGTPGGPSCQPSCMLVQGVTCPASCLAALPCPIRLKYQEAPSPSPTVTPTRTIDPVEIMYEPRAGFLSTTALGVFAMVTSPYTSTSRIYYSFEKLQSLGDATGTIPSTPTESSPYITLNNPYIHIARPFGSYRNRTVSMIAVDEATGYRSREITAWYSIEADARPNSYGFLVPGVETQGYFIKFYLEMKAAARAQAAGGQEFADFNTDLGVGTYAGQIFPLHLPSLDLDLTGFEGGFSVNCSYTQHYGILVPFHTGKKFSGKVVRVDLMNMNNVTDCLLNFRKEWLDDKGVLKVQYGGTRGNSQLTACVSVIDLTTMDPNARGFRRGFAGGCANCDTSANWKYPYGFLSASEFSVSARIDVCNFGVSTTKLLDLSLIDPSLGGYQGGFSDNLWSCFNPMKTFVGPFGGYRSQEAVDVGHMQPFFHGRMVCVENSLWTETNTTRIRLAQNRRTAYIVDFSLVSPSLRGFSEVIRVGRFAYFAPLASSSHDYSSVLVKLYLGQDNIGLTMKVLQEKNLDLRDVVSILDLSFANPNLRGFSGIFSSGKFLFLVPYRNAFEPKIGQRGHGFVTRVDMNNFDVSGVNYMQCETQSRFQIPSTADDDLRGFSGGYASGKYHYFIPFFNGLFSGKVGRIGGLKEPMVELQELDLTKDRFKPDTYKAYRSGFTSLWRGEDCITFKEVDCPPEQMAIKK